MDFTKFDAKVDLEGLQKDVKEAEKNGFDGNYPEVPKGKYEVSFEKIEIKGTKTEPKDRPMLSAMARILDGEYKKQCVFLNRVLFGTKNDANMINSAVGWLKSLGTDVNISFESYSQFDSLVMDVAEAVDGSFEYAIEYDPNAFNTISIKEVFEV